MVVDGDRWWWMMIRREVMRWQIVDRKIHVMSHALSDFTSYLLVNYQKL